MDSFFEVSMELEKFHAIFAKLWQIGRPRFTDDIDTAAIAFDRDGGFIEFVFNEEFYDKLSMEEKAAVISHECLHVILNHGFRMKGLIPQIANIAADIVINELLVKGFGFSRDLDVFKTACFIDTVFKNRKVEENREFEYYYKELMKDVKFVEQSGMNSLDDHSKMPSMGDMSEEMKNAVKGLSKEEGEKLAKKLEDSGEDSKEPNNMDPENGEGKDNKSHDKQAGTGSGFTWIRTLCKPKVIRKWESVVKDWVIKAFRNKDVEQFVSTNRRYAILDATSNFLLPNESERDDTDDGMVDVVFFMDVSGSCYEVSKKFYKAAKSIPQDKFKIDAYAFDTQIVKLDLKKNDMPYGGGTAFDIMEHHLQKLKRYPTLVFVLTDGYGTKVVPQYPSRWHIFLTEDCKHCFPENVHFHKFEDFSCD